MSTGPYAMARAAFSAARRGGAAVTGMRRRARRRLLLVSLAVRAAWVRSTVDARIAPDAVLGRRLRVEIEPHSRSSIDIGPLCRVGDDVAVHLRGGRLQLGYAVDVRRGCTFEVAGRIELVGPNLVQHHSSIHCDDCVTVGPYAVLSEQVTLVDSTHPADGPHEWFLDNLLTAPVTIGPHAWLGAKATVARGVHVGQRAVVSANSLVVRDVAPGWLVSGVPASPMRAAEASDGPDVPDRHLRSLGPARAGGREQ